MLPLHAEAPDNSGEKNNNGYTAQVAAMVELVPTDSYTTTENTHSAHYHTRNFSRRCRDRSLQHTQQLTISEEKHLRTMRTPPQEIHKDLSSIAANVINTTISYNDDIYMLDVWDTLEHDRRGAILNYRRHPITIYHDHGRYAIHTSCKASPLPDEFRDNFSSTGFFHNFFHKNRDYQHDLTKQIKQDTSTSSSYKYRKACHERAMMRQWRDYRYSEFTEFIESLPTYDEYVQEIAAQLEHDTIFADYVKQASEYASDYIRSQAKQVRDKQTKIAKRKAQEARVSEQHTISQLILHHQAGTVDELAQNWSTSDPKRHQAYAQIKQNLHHIYEEKHKLAPQAKNVLRKYNYKASDFTLLNGNTLQHTFLDEITTQLNNAGELHPQVEDAKNDLLQAVHENAVMSLDTARKTNQVNDTIATVSLIDYCSTALDYCSAVIEGAAEGTYESIVGSYHMVRHPIKSAQALGNFAITAGRVVHEYNPIQSPEWLCQTAEEHEAWLARQEEISPKWQQLADNAYQWWHTTPHRNKVKIASKTLTTNVSNVYIAHCCSKLLTKCAQLAAAKMKAASSSGRYLQSSASEIASTTGNITREVEYTSKTAAPACRFLQQVESSAHLMRKGEELSYKPQAVSLALQRLEEEGGCIQRFCRTVEELEHIPGTEPHITKVLAAEEKAGANIRGSFFELESALQCKERGEAVLFISKKYTHPQVGTKEFDIVTPYKLIECKNCNWSIHIKKTIIPINYYVFKTN